MSNTEYRSCKAVFLHLHLPNRKKMEKVSAEKSEIQSSIPKEQYLKWYESMLLMRRFEERAQQMYLQQKIRGFCHIYIGQEAVAAGSVSAIRPEDNIITAYRDHAFPIAKGMEPNM